MSKIFQHVQQSLLKEPKGIRRQTHYLSSDKVYLENYGVCVCVCKQSTMENRLRILGWVFSTLVETRQSNCPYLY